MEPRASFPRQPGRSSLHSSFCSHHRPGPLQEAARVAHNRVRTVPRGSPDREFWTSVSDRKLEGHGGVAHRPELVVRLPRRPASVVVDPVRCWGPLLSDRAKHTLVPSWSKIREQHDFTRQRAGRPMVPGAPLMLLQSDLSCSTGIGENTIRFYPRRATQRELGNHLKFLWRVRAILVHIALP